MAVRSRRGLGGPLVLGLLLSAASSVVAPSASSAPIKASTEKSVPQGGFGKKPPASPTDSTTAGAKKGSVDALPPELRAKAKAWMEKRLKDNLVEIGRLRDEAERLLEAFIKEEPKGSPDLPEALLKLAEIKWEKARDKYVAVFAEWEKKPVSGRGPAPVMSFGEARGLVKQVLDGYPTYKDYDLALYVDGALASEEGKDTEAIARFAMILAKYPKSRFSPDAHMAMGEAAFNEKADWAKALAEYEEVLKHPQSELYGLALFKSAWCLWKLNKTDEAAKRFTKVLEVTSAKAGASMAKRQALEALEDEALRALVDVFIEDEGTSAQDVYNFLLKIGGDRFAGKIIRKLATAYEDAARYKKEIEAYELLRKLEPSSPDATDHVLSIARAWAVEGDDDKVFATYARLLDEHLPAATLPPAPGAPAGAAGKTTSATWAKSQVDPEVVKKSTGKIEKDLRTRAVEHHARGQATTNKNDFILAAKLYQLYLTRFRDHENAYDVLFYVAEIEFHRLGQDSEAARDYLACAKQNPKGGLSRDALFNAISALERLRAKELSEGKGKTGDETETDKRFAEALAFYASAYPDDPEIPGFLLAQGVTYYDHKIFDPAIKIFGELLTRYPKSKEAAAAGDRMIDSLVHAKDFGNVESWGRKLKGLPAYAADASQKRLDGLIVQAVFKQGEALSTKGDHAGAAAAYLRAAKEFPKDERASKACVNAVVEGRTAADLALARTAADLALNQHPKTPEAPLAAWNVAQALSAAGLLADSASYDERLVREYPKDPHARDSAFNAVVTRTALGDYDLAVKDANLYLEKFGGGTGSSADDADEVTFLLGQAHEKAKKFAEAAKLYGSYSVKAKNMDHKIEALVRLAEVQVQLKNETAAAEALKQAVKLGTTHHKTLKEGKIHAAHARYLQGERVVAAYDAVTLDATGPELKKRLDKKKELLKEAGTIYGDCAKMGAGEWTTAALYRIGYVFEGFATALKGAKPPSSASAEETEKFHEIVDPIAEQFTEKAIDAYENGWKKAIELKIFNRWTAELRSALSRLNDVEFPALREVGLEVRSIGPSPLPDVVDAPLGVGAAKAKGGGK